MRELNDFCVQTRPSGTQYKILAACWLNVGPAVNQPTSRIICTRINIRIHSTNVEKTLLCETKRQYLLTCKVSRYCILALHGITGVHMVRIHDAGCGDTIIIASPHGMDTQAKFGPGRRFGQLSCIWTPVGAIIYKFYPVCLPPSQHPV